MKWELVVTDPSAGKTGRVRIEAPDAATAERIAEDKGWTVTSVRVFEPASAPAGVSVSLAPPPSAPPVPYTPPPEPEAEQEQESTATDSDSEESPYPYGGTDEEETASVSAAVPAPEPAPVSPRRSTLRRSQGQPITQNRPISSQGMTPIAPVATSLQSVVPSAAPPGVGFTSAALSVIFWIAALALIGWGAMHISYALGYPHIDSFPNSTEAGVMANRTFELRGLVRLLVGGVFIVGGLLSAILGTLLSRRR